MAKVTCGFLPALNQVQILLQPPQLALPIVFGVSVGFFIVFLSLRLDSFYSEIILVYKNLDSAGSTMFGANKLLFVELKVESLASQCTSQI